MMPLQDLVRFTSCLRYWTMPGNNPAIPEEFSMNERGESCGSASPQSGTLAHEPDRIGRHSTRSKRSSSSGFEPA